MKFLAQVAILLMSANVQAEGTFDQSTIFSILEKAGVFVNYTYTTQDTTGKIDLQVISCTQRDISLETSCFYVDAARPLEKGELEGNNANYIFDAMIYSGAQKLHVFGETIASLAVLRCERRVSNAKNSPSFKCSTLKPLFN